MSTYIVGTYGLKYYKQITNEDGTIVKLEIHQRSFTGTSREIARIRGLNFAIQGSQDLPDAPIAKTSLTFSVLDNAHESGIDSNGVKYTDSRYLKFAYWTEFYTPDATKYLVKLYHNGRHFWSGYLTPDSYTESLDAFGFVQLTARDNLGHLSDFEFDAEGTDGMISVYNLIVAAMQKVCMPLNVSFNDESDDRQLASEGAEVEVRDLLMCVSAFDGKDWFDSVEEVLNSVGWCMRFDDCNGLIVGPLRNWPMLGWSQEDDPPTGSVKFLGRGAGTRMFDPAYKEIVEKIDFGQKDELSLDVLIGKQNGGYTNTNDYFVTVFDQDVVDPYGSTSSRSSYSRRAAPAVSSAVGPLKFGEWESLPKTSILESEDYTLQDFTEESEGSSMHDYLFLTANTGTLNGTTPTWADENHEFQKKLRSANVKVKVQFADHPAGFDNNGKIGVYPFNLKEIKYTIKYTVGNSVRYWNGNYWQQTLTTLTQTWDPTQETANSLEAELSECQELGAYGTLSIILNHIVYQSVSYWWTYSSGWTLVIQSSVGVYARLKEITFTSQATKVAKSNKVTTVVNSAYNVKCERNPMFSCLPTSVAFVSPRNYENAFFYKDSDDNIQAAPYNWKWTDDSVALPFPVKIHQQLLMWHYTTEEVLEGNAKLCDFERTGSDPELRYDAQIKYKNIWHLMQSVNHDMLSERLTSVTLRSFKEYSALWDGDETQSSSGSLS